jgi:hypothetical protein
MINKNRETRAYLWVPQTPHTSRDLLILVERSTQPVVPSDLCLPRSSSAGGAVEGSLWVPEAVSNSGIGR